MTLIQHLLLIGVAVHIITDWNLKSGSKRMFCAKQSGEFSAFISIYFESTTHKTYMQSQITFMNTKYHFKMTLNAVDSVS